MRAYSCIVLLKGNLYNQVPKVLTAPEIMVMRWLHGADAVINIAEYGDYAKDVRKGGHWSNQEERDRLKNEYDPYLKAERGGRNPTSIDQMFGMFNDLPTKLPEGAYESGIDEDDELLEREQVGKAAKSMAAKETKKPRTPPADTKTVAPVDIVDVE